MLNSPEGPRLRMLGLGLAMSVGALSMHGGEGSPTVEQSEVVQETTHPSLPLAGQGTLEREELPRASRSRRQPTPTSTTTPTSPGKDLGMFESTCYNLRGITASGKRAGYGRVAVDPAVIRLGTRLHIEGYGDAVAADTGGLIDGRIIDVWKPTAAQCSKWGRHMVHVTELP